MREILTDINEETNNNTTVVDFSTPLISMYKSFTEKSNKEIVALNAH